MEHNIIAILAKACKCPLSVKSLKVGSTRVICKDEMAGSFMTDLATDDMMLQKQIVCGMDHMIKMESTPSICKLVFRQFFFKSTYDPYIFQIPLCYRLLGKSFFRNDCFSC